MRFAGLLVAVLLVAPLAAQPELAYRHVEGWPQWPADFTPGAGMAVAVDTGGNVWYYNRGSHPVIQFNPEGRVLQAWKEDPKLSNHAAAAHGMTVGADGGVWLVDRETNRIWKFSPEGRVLQAIGGFSGRQGDDSAKYAFNRPADAAHDSAGNTYIADGYQNTRVVKYGPRGDYITHWGGPGAERGKFKLVHGVAVGPQDRVYVADRGNNRIQVFDSDGRFMTLWEGFGTPWALTYDKRENVVWTCDGDAGRVLKLSLEGQVLGGFASDGPAAGQLHQAHGIAVGADGAIYVAETRNNRVQKFVKR